MKRYSHILEYKNILKSEELSPFIKFLFEKRNSTIQANISSQLHKMLQRVE